MTDRTEMRIAMVLVAIISALGIMGIFARVSAQRTCLRAGYPDSRVDWRLTRYCVKRVNQTDIVVPVDDLQLRPQSFMVSPTGVDPDPDAVELYRHLVERTGTMMTEQEFRAIRAKNREEQEEFGNGENAPHWPNHKLNGHFTLRRGVWIDDDVAMPSDKDIDRIREMFRRKEIR